jgi:hypothetical protein
VAGTLTSRHEKTSVKILKLIGLILFELVKQIWLLPETIANFIKGRQQQKLVNEMEVERLDRIRNPHKYRGK